MTDRLKERLREHMKKNDLTIRRAHLQIGIDRGTLESVLNKKYTPHDDVEKIIKDYLRSADKDNDNKEDEIPTLPKGKMNVDL